MNIKQLAEELATLTVDEVVALDRELGRLSSETRVYITPLFIEQIASIKRACALCRMGRAEAVELALESTDGGTHTRRPESR